MSSTQEVGEIFGAGTGPAHAMLRSPTVLIASIGLWGMNVYFFRVFGIDYAKVLHHDLLKLQDPEDSNGNNKSDHSSGAGSGGYRRSNSWAMTNRNKGDSSNGGGGGGGANNNNQLDCNSSADHEIDDEEGAIMGDDHSTNTADDHDAIGDEITAPRLVFLSLSLLFLLHSTYFIWIDWLGGGTMGAIFAFYGAIMIAMLFPLQSTRWLRHAAWLVLHRALELINPRCCTTTTSTSSSCRGKSPPEGGGDNSNSGPRIPRPIPFIDVFFADAMCSLSKVFFDWGMLLHMASYYPKPVPASAWNILLPSAFAAVPFFIRARQCLVMWRFTSLKNDPGRYQHLWNALKYSTSIFPLCLSAYQKTMMKDRAHDLEKYLIVLLVINAGYALWWDIVMDWGMMKNPTVAATVICNPAVTMNNPSNALMSNTNSPYLPVPTRDPSPLMRTTSGTINKGSAGSGSHHSCWYYLLRNRLRFGVAISVLILSTDVILRFSWLLRFYHRLFPSGDSFVLCTQFLEVFRRAIWNLLRVEWENLKQSGHHLPAPPMSKGSPANLVQMIPVTNANADEEKARLLNQRGGHVVGAADKNSTLRKIPYEKNAEA